MPPPPVAEDALSYSWNCHPGRAIKRNFAGNNPYISDAFLLGLKYRWTQCANGKDGKIPSSFQQKLREENAMTITAEQTDRARAIILDCLNIHHENQVPFREV